MKQRIRPLLLFKKRNAAMQRIGQNTWALQNRLMDDTLFGAPRPVQAWSDGKDCASGGAVILEFTDPVFYGVDAGDDGITITAEPGGKTFTPVVASASGQTDQQYTGSWSAALIAGDVVTISYDQALGTLNDGVAAPDTAFVRSFNVIAENCLDPPVLLSAVATSQSTIVLSFDRSVSGSETLGVTWGGATSVTVATSSGLPGTTITYDINETLFNDSVVTWSYVNPPGDIARTDSGIALGEVVNYPVNVSALLDSPPSPNSGWGLEGGIGGWSLEGGIGGWSLDD